MTRMLSLAAVVAFIALLMSSLSVTAQESDSCQKCPSQKCGNCHAIEFELTGVDFSEESGEAVATGYKKTEDGTQITIKVSDGPYSGVHIISPETASNLNGVPFLSNLPHIRQFCRTVKPECCDVTVADAKCDLCDDNSNGCPSCEQCECTCGKETQDEIKFEVSWDCNLPFLSSVPYISRLFSNTDSSASESKKTCQSCECSSNCADEPCPGSRCCDIDDDAAAGALVRLVGHLDETRNEGPTPTEMMHELFELRVENERLEANVEAMEQHMELMLEMCEVREENAALKARLELLENHPAHAAFFHARPVTATSGGTFAVIGSPHPPHTAHVPQAVESATAAVGAMLHPPVCTTSAQVRGKLPTARRVEFITHDSLEPAEIQRLRDQVRALQRDLNERRCEGSRLETPANSTDQTK